MNSTYGFARFALGCALVSLVAMVGCGLQTADDGNDPDDNINVNCGTCGSGGSAGAADTDAGATGGSAGAADNDAATGDAANTDADADADTDSAISADCAAKYPNLTAPLTAPAAWTLSVSGQYLPIGTDRVWIVGSVPGTSWTQGLATTPDGSGRYVGLIPNVSGFSPGTYQVQYVNSTALVNGSIPTASFADFGKDQDRVHCMSAAAKAFLWCNVASDGHTLNGCELRVYIDARGNISPAGNLPTNY